MSVALANIVDGEDLKRAIDSFEFDYGILESIPLIYIGEMKELKRELEGEIEPDNFESGRLFSSNLEIRWRRGRGNEFYTLIITDEDKSLDGYEKMNLAIKNTLSFYLWGEKAEDMWYELRIPKGWKYPVEGKYAKIKVTEYSVEGKAEEATFYRFCGFVGVDK